MRKPWLYVCAVVLPVLTGCGADTAGEPERLMVELTTSSTMSLEAQASALDTAHRLATTTAPEPATTSVAPVPPESAPVPVTAPPAPVPTTEPPAATQAVWDELAACETGGRWDAVAGEFQGGLMFHDATWDSYGGGAYATDANLATREQQIVVAERVLADVGWGAWPGCTRRMGLR